MVSVKLLLVILLLVAVAVVTDVARHKIYNWNVYPGIVLGFVLNGVNAILAGGSLWSGLRFSLEGFLACGLVMLVCFVFFDIGGGDVKLIAMMGAFLGLEKGVEAMLWTFVLGSIVGATMLIWQLGALHILKKSLHHIFLILRARSWIAPTEEERQPLKRWLFLAPSAFAAICIVASGVFK